MDQNYKIMDLAIYISKKGTKVVLATDLHQALQLPDHHYATNTKKWLNDLYEFDNGIRKPLRMQEFAPRKTEDEVIWQDYYLSVDLAKQIVLRCKSKFKQKYALQLAEQSEEGLIHGLSAEQFKHLVEVTRAMTLVSCQEEFERRHLRTYKERNDNSAANWWKYRATVMGYTTDELREKLRRRGVTNLGGSQRQLLAQIDPLELIRAGVVDLFMAIGKSQQYACRMGELAKSLAQTMELQVIDDDRKVDLFTEAVDPNLVHQLKKPLSEQLVAA